MYSTPRFDVCQAVLRSGHVLNVKAPWAPPPCNARSLSRRPWLGVSETSNAALDDADAMAPRCVRMARPADDVPRGLDVPSRSTAVPHSLALLLDVGGLGAALLHLKNRHDPPSMPPYHRLPR